jgi:hypothetical protein
VSRADPDPGEGPVGGDVATVLQVQAAGLDVPIAGGDEPPGGSHALARICRFSERTGPASPGSNRTYPICAELY